MWGSVRRSRRLIAGLALAVGLALPVAADPPRRVVSINLCTDQLAMMLAAPGQLVSVSHLAADPYSSAMAEDGARYPANHGLAEEVFLLRPDLVLGGRYTAQATVDLLERLGVPVVTLPPVRELDEIPEHLRIIGAALGRTPEAEALVAQFQADLAALSAPEGATAPLGALYYANGYSLGARSLAGQVLARAGFRNTAAEAGLTGGGHLPLEALILANPDLVLRGTPYPGQSRSEEILTHPALAALGQGAPAPRLTDRDWICGTPRVIHALAELAQTRRALTGEPR